MCFKVVFNAYSAKYETSADFYCANIWYNQKITVIGRSVYSKSLYNLEILCVNDLIDEHGYVHAFEYVQNALQSEIYFLEYTG